MKQIDTKGKPVIFYGAGYEAQFEAAKYRAKGVVPACFCDQNPAKWGKPFLGFDCLSLDQAIEKYPDFLMVITPRYPLRFHIMEDLIQRGIVTQEQLLNYEPYVKRKGCTGQCGFIGFNYSKRLMICFACDMSDNIYESPSVEFDGDIESSVAAFLGYRDKLIRGLNGGTEKEAAKCSECRWAVEDYWPVDQRFRTIVYSVGGGCQFDCCYCDSIARHTMIEETWEKDARLGAIASYLEEKGLLHPDVVFEIGPGEISVAPRRDEIFDVTKNYYSKVFTNAGVWSERMAEQISEGTLLNLLVSVDSGTRETFQKVKGADAFQAVKENLRKYHELGAIVEVKYIFLDGINDDAENVDGFVSLAQEVGAQTIFVSTDNRKGGASVSRKVMEMIQRMVMQARKCGIAVSMTSAFFTKDDAEQIAAF